MRVAPPFLPCPPAHVFQDRLRQPCPGVAGGGGGGGGGPLRRRRQNAHVARGAATLRNSSQLSRLCPFVHVLAVLLRERRRKAEHGRLCSGTLLRRWRGGGACVRFEPLDECRYLRLPPARVQRIGASGGCSGVGLALGRGSQLGRESRLPLARRIEKRLGPVLARAGGDVQVRRDGTQGEAAGTLVLPADPPAKAMKIFGRYQGLRHRIAAIGR